MRVMQVPFYEKIGVVTMRNRFMPASGTMLMSLDVPFATVFRRARIRVLLGHSKHMLIVMAAVVMVQVAVMQVVGVVAVLDGSVPAVRTVLMMMIVMVVVSVPVPVVMIMVQAEGFLDPPDKRGFDFARPYSGVQVIHVMIFRAFRR